MARPGLLKHRKFIRLARFLGSGGRHRAYGLIGLLCEAGYEAGEPIIGDADDVEAVCDWDGKPGELVEALQSCGGAGSGFIDKLEDGRFEIHDFWTHAPSYVRRRAEREAAREKAGVSLSELRAAAGRLGVQAKRSKRQANDQQFALTPNSQHPTTSRPTGFAWPAASAGGVGGGFKEQNQEFTTPPPTTTSSAGSAEFEGKGTFLALFNECRAAFDMSATEEVEAKHLPQLRRMLAQIAKQRPHDTESTTRHLIMAFLEDPKVVVPELSTLLSPKSWPRRLDRLCRDLPRYQEPEKPPAQAQQPDSFAGALWSRMLQLVHDDGKRYAITWLNRMGALDIREGQLLLEVPDLFFRDWVDDHYRALMREALARTNSGCSDVKLLTREQFDALVPAAAAD